VPYEDVRYLNPSYILGIIPYTGEPSTLVLPRQKIAAFITNERAIYDYADRTKPSRNYVPNPVNSQAKGSSAQSSDLSASIAKYHKVKKGESLGTIASRYHVTTTQIRKWNGMRSSTVHSGQTLVVKPATKAAPTVKTDNAPKTDAAPADNTDKGTTDKKVDNDVDNNANIAQSKIANLSSDLTSLAPKATNIYISTKTKIAYLDRIIDLKKIFWDVPVIPYAKPCNGVIKKQMKFNLASQEELTFIQDKLQSETYFEEHVITHIDNPTGRIKFKDIRKVSIGISKKDIMSYRCKKKSAFYNCFVLILRTKVDSVFKEFHVKVFNTGKLEIPGVQSETNFQMILSQVLEILQPYLEEKLEYKENNTIIARASRTINNNILVSLRLK
jgi:LysM repeat protein